MKFAGKTACPDKVRGGYPTPAHIPAPVVRFLTGRVRAAPLVSRSARLSGLIHDPRSR